jgi:hypothetical protein
LKSVEKLNGSVIGVFIGFGVGLMIIHMDVALPFVNIADYMTEHVEGVSDWLYKKTLKGFLIPHISVFLTYFFPSWIVALVYFFKYDRQEGEVFKRGSQPLSAKGLREHIVNS